MVRDEKAVIQKRTPWRDELHFCSQACVEAYAVKHGRRPMADAPPEVPEEAITSTLNICTADDMDITPATPDEDDAPAAPDFAGDGGSFSGGGASADFGGDE
jgi:hypothetical protein